MTPLGYRSGSLVEGDVSALGSSMQAAASQFMWSAATVLLVAYMCICAYVRMCAEALRKGVPFHLFSKRNIILRGMACETPWFSAAASADLCIMSFRKGMPRARPSGKANCLASVQLEACQERNWGANRARPL
ncbi:hypothetical protein F5X99DRAFT_409224 [Biscogniauxia marginata]|nr:hypothetical protein F5X99DRAFT_409224 [Biscogniauxia marginata]